MESSFIPGIDIYFSSMIMSFLIFFITLLCIVPSFLIASSNSNTDTLNNREREKEEKEKEKSDQNTLPAIQQYNIPPFLKMGTEVTVDTNPILQVEYYQYNPDKVEEIYLGINHFYSNIEKDHHQQQQQHQAFPQIFNPNLGGIIGAYSHDDAINEFHDGLMEKLKASPEERISLNFYNDDFAPKLLSLVKSKMHEIHNLHIDSPYGDLERLLFKWVIFKSREHAENVAKLEEMAKEFNSLLKDLKQTSYRFFPFFDSKDPIENKFNLSMFIELIKYEVFENPMAIHLFNSIKRDYYGGKDRGMTISCDDLKNKYFQGDFNKNILLKLLILTQDYQFELRKCFDENERESIPLEDSYKATISEMENSQEIEYLRIDDFVDSCSPNPDYLSTVIIKFFLDRNLKFSVSNSSNLVILLRKLEKLKSLIKSKKKPLSEIIEFLSEGVKKWDQEKFNKQLTTMREGSPRSTGNRHISKEEYNRYLELANELDVTRKEETKTIEELK